MQRKLIDRLRVVRHRAVGIDRDRDRPHAEEPEGHQTEREDRGRQHESAQAEGADAVGDGHQEHHASCPASRR